MSTNLGKSSATPATGEISDIVKKDVVKKNGKLKKQRFC
jgi:hypothetical protein